MKINIAVSVIVAMMLMLMAGCSGSGDKDTQERVRLEKPEVKAKKVVKTQESDDDSDDLDKDFQEDKEGEVDLDKDFTESEEGEADETPEGEIDQSGEEKASYKRIQKVSFQPEIIRADSDTELFVQVKPGLGTNEVILYNLRKNGTISIENSETNVFKKDLYRKGDLVAFDVMLVRDDNIIEEQKTRQVVVANSTPVITSMPNIVANAGYKVYTFDVRAEDSDGDTVTFELDGEVPIGMKINEFSGRISYNFNGPPEKKSFVFNVIARDSDGAEARREVRLVFKIKEKSEES